MAKRTLQLTHLSLPWQALQLLRLCLKDEWVSKEHLLYYRLYLCWALEKRWFEVIYMTKPIDVIQQLNLILSNFSGTDMCTDYIVRKNGQFRGRYGGCSEDTIKDTYNTWPNPLVLFNNSGNTTAKLHFSRHRSSSSPWRLLLTTSLSKLSLPKLKSQQRLLCSNNRMTTMTTMTTLPKQQQKLLKLSVSKLKSTKMARTSVFGIWTTYSLRRSFHCLRWALVKMRGFTVIYVTEPIDIFEQLKDSPSWLVSLTIILSLCHSPTKQQQIWLGVPSRQ